MKKIFILSLMMSTSVFAKPIDANTPIKWNMNVMEEALRKFDYNIFGGFSYSHFATPLSPIDIAKMCIDDLIERYHNCDGNAYGSRKMPSLQECFNTCANFVEELIKINNEFAYVGEFADNTRNKSTCENYNKTLWLDSEGICIPKNPCMFNQYTKYCIQWDSFRFDYNTKPDGNLTAMDVANIYVREGLNLSCEIVEKEAYKENGHTFVPCKGPDNRILQFDDGDMNIVGLLCFAFPPTGSLSFSHDGSTYCGMSQKRCERVKSLIGDKIKVEYKPDVPDGPSERCEIGG